MLHGHLMVNRGYELIVYRIVWVTKNFPKCWHDIYNGLNGTLSMVCESGVELTLGVI